MRVAIHQPNYLPYPGFFAKANLCDILVIYDTSQFTRGDYINRNKIRTFLPNGYMWLTLPVGKRNFRGVPINKVRIKDSEIFCKHGKIIRTMYSKAPFFDDEVCQKVAVGHGLLSEHNLFLLDFLLRRLHINQPKIILSSTFNVPVRQGTFGIIDIVKALNADWYISGIGAKSYLKSEIFKKESVKLSFVDYNPLKYTQIHPGFVENMSIIDTIFNIGWSETSSRLTNVSLKSKEKYSFQ